jgi:hypothetical protein
MKRLTSQRPSPSLVLSMITLFVAITSTAGALPGRNLVEKGDIAKGAVTKRALARGAVNTKAIRKGAVTSPKIANEAVVERTLAPSSVGASALGDTATVPAPIVDNDPIAGNLDWTTSPSAAAACPPGSALLGGGVSITNGVNNRVFVQTSAPTADRWEGAISTDTGGTSSGRVYAICLL